MAVTMAATGSRETVALGDEVAFLTEMPGVVQVIETPMAFVFLNGVLAFKLKRTGQCGIILQPRPGLFTSTCACTQDVTWALVAGWRGSARTASVCATSGRTLTALPMPKVTTG